MPVYTDADAVLFEAHGSRFNSYASPSRNSSQLCGWRLEVPAGLSGTAHRPTREELLLVLEGELRVHIDGAAATAGPGDVVLVPADSEFRVDGGPSGAVAWVSTTAGLQARLPDGSTMSPPWAA